MTQSKSFDVVAVDGIDVDWLLTMPKLPSFDEKLPATLLGRFPGGPVGNFACIGSHLGLKAASMCTLGDDEGGRLIKQDFEKNGVDTSFITVRPDVVTPFVIVVVDPTGEKAVVVPKLPSNPEPALLPEAFGQARYIYMMGHTPRRFFRVAEAAAAAGARIMVDFEPSAQVDAAQLHAMLAHCSIASFNVQGFTHALDTPFSIDAVRSLLADGPALILVTRGRRGAVAVSQDEVVSVPAFDVDVQDTTGAGDTFNAAFLYAYLQNKPLKDCVLFANAAAAILIQTLGTRTSLPTPQKIDEFIRHNALEKGIDT